MIHTSAYTPEEDIAAVATALAPAALGVLRTSGAHCIEKMQRIFSRPNALKKAGPNTMLYGWIQDEGRRVDEVMLFVYRGPKSFTGEDMVEISCHGGLSVINAIYALLLKNGFRAAQRGEFTFRAYLNGKSDLTKAEAIREIIDSRTDEARGRAAGRLAGSLYSEIDRIKHFIIDTLAALEVEIEYPEDEETIADSFDTQNLIQAKNALKSLADSWSAEKLYQDGARVVLCGRTNAGKSSLFNALLKEERAIVSDIEGTTRDWIESWVSFAGIPARLFDTAGLRKTDDFVEQKGVERTKDLVQDADLILYLADVNEGLLQDDLDFLQHQNNSIPLIFVWNKCDTLQKDFSCKNVQKSNIPNLVDSPVQISAKTGTGVGQLCALVKSVLNTSGTIEREQAGLGSKRQLDSVCDALESIEHALLVAKEGYSLDAVVQDLEDALEALGELTGEVRADDVLDSVFSRFCVGK